MCSLPLLPSAGAGNRCRKQVQETGAAEEQQLSVGASGLHAYLNANQLSIHIGKAGCTQHNSSHHDIARDAYIKHQDTIGSAQYST
jgi:hypothetical protein